MDNKTLIRHYCQQFKMNAIPRGLDQLIKEAETSSMGYLEFTTSILKTEAAYREQNDLNKRIKVARLPPSSDLTNYDHSVGNGLSKARINQLRELNWLDQLYNIILMGPSGTGKTYLAAGLCSEAVSKGYKAYFRSMEEIMNMLTMKDFARTAKGDYKRLSKANLIVIDDIMLFPVEKRRQLIYSISLISFMKKHPLSLPPTKNQHSGLKCSVMRFWPLLY